MKSNLRWYCAIFVLFLAGCSSHSNYRFDSMLATPLQPTLQQEAMLARLEQILSIVTLKDDERAQLLYERGVLYDSLGLRALARNDFSLALLIRPDMPDVYNYLGIYLTQAGDFNAAYEAFDSVLELDPTYDYARLNRGIAFYYGGRYQLAQEDLRAFCQQDPNDPFRMIWLYFIQVKLNPNLAITSLERHYAISDKKQWGWNIVAFYLGKISLSELMTSLQKDATDNTSLAEHLSETNFYLGKYYLNRGDKSSALALFKLAVANNVHDFIEHRYALLELVLLGQGQDDLSESDQ